MKGYWHIPAFGIIVSFFTVIMDMAWFFLVFTGWLIWVAFKKRLPIMPFFFSFLFFFYFLNNASVVKSNYTERNQRQIHSGTIMGAVTYTEDRLEFKLMNEETREKMLVQLFPKNQNPLPINKDIVRGAKCQLNAESTVIDEATNPGQFNYKRYLAQQQIFTVLRPISIDEIYCSGESVFSHLDSFRQTIQDYLLETYRLKTAAWLNALIFGNDSLIDEETVELFRRWNLAHILAISGLHVGLVISMLYFTFVKTGLLTKEKAQTLLILFLPLYAVIAGGEPSVWRASMMALFILICLKFNIKVAMPDVISIVFIVFVFIEPEIIYHIGFQFSFLVTFGLILSKNWLLEDTSIPFQILKISFVAQMIILPLQIIYFYQFNPLSIIINVVIVPYFSLFVIPSMFLLLIISPLAFLNNWFELLFNSIHSFMLALLERIDMKLYVSWTGGEFPGYFPVVFYGLFLLFMLLIEQKKQRQAFQVGVCLTLFLSLMFCRPYLSPYGTVTMLDIGQGDALVIELPFRKGVILYDAGATFSFTEFKPDDRVFRQIIKPFLDYKGIQQIDALILSHEDMDHMGSVDFIVKAFSVKQIIVSDYYHVNMSQQQIWSEQGTELQRVETNDKIIIGNHPFTVLAPFKDAGNDNDNSLVLYTVFADKSWLLTGDIGKSVERQMIRHYPNLQIDVLKVAHHGSNSSTDRQFIKQVQPTYALISAGRKNRYGHPASEVMATLEENEIRVFRTDEHGAVIFHYHKEGEFDLFFNK
ncbi:MAG TPA: DNA internalization-related competence protein ComEC/Rec2 [Cerasibacillus sp.]|uniref:DNA internalization-related competence protein ComEC/Rec2 n=1 Tax=Cerasibacillus sp. TaxID=2498711 RepID=UPI002F4020A1